MAAEVRVIGWRFVVAGELRATSRATRRGFVVAAELRATRRGFRFDGVFVAMIALRAGLFAFDAAFLATACFRADFLAFGFDFDFDFGFAMRASTILRSLAIALRAGHGHGVTLDLDAYLERIGYRGALAADFATVAGLLDRHVIAIPFENLDVLLGRPPRLDLESLQDKLVRACRGGYCYEHTTLFAAVLSHIGFQITAHSARVTLVAPRSAAPRTHMFLTVVLPEGTFVLDPGFGGLTPRVPVPVDGTAVHHGEDQFRLARDGDVHVLEVSTPEKTVEAWVSSLEHDLPVDFEMANHFTATHPSSHFTRRLMLRAFTDDGRITIVNRDLTRYRGTMAETIQLADRKALRQALVTHFGFDLDVDALRVPMIPEWT